MLQYFSQARQTQDTQYTTEDFLFRWKKLERVLAKQGVDGLLIATGLDAKDCVHSAYLFNWLFLGLSGKSITINKYLDPIYSQLIIIVSPKGSFIFITPNARDNLQNLIYSIPNCTVFCPTQEQYENKQLLDTLKITQFYTATEKIGRLGFYLGQNQDIKIIQKWPLVQSYALEPVGKTFFTLKHQAVNLSGKISHLFKNLDKHSIKSLVNRTAFSLQGHVKGALAIIQLKSPQQRQAIAQTTIQQPLQEAVQIGLFGSGREQYKGFVRVLFGQRTQSAAASSPTATITSENAQHLTIQHFDPYTKMKIWRSYFLNINVKNLQKVSLEQKQQSQSFIVKNFYTLQQRQNTNYQKQNVLISLYVSLVQGVLESISSVSKDYRNLNSQFIGKLVLAKINATAKEIYGAQVFTNNNVIAQVQSFDSFGDPRPIDFKDSISFKLTSTFYIIKLRLKSIFHPSTKQKLGSLIFSQSFLIQQGCYLLLTKKTPYFDYWKCKPYNQILSNLNPNYDFEILGKALSQGFKNRMFIPSEKLSYFHLNIPILNVRYYFHQKGLRIFNDKIGWQVLLYNEINDLTMVNKIPGQWVLLRTKRNFVFDCLQNNILAIQFKGKPFQFLMKQVKSKQNPIQLTFIDQIPPLLSQNWYFCSQILKKPIKDGAVLFQFQILVNDFLWSFIQAKQLMIINQMKDIKMAAFRSIYQTKVEKKKENAAIPEGKHSIMIINGTYGAGKYNLARSLKRFGPNQVPCEIFRVSSDNLFKKIPTQTFVEMIEQHIKQNQLPKNKTLIVIIPSWINTAEVLNLLQQKFHIRSVLSKVNASNFFATKNNMLVENALTFCLPGYSQNIVIDAFAEEQSLVNRVIKIVGSFNRESNVFRSTNCLLTTGQCSDIMLNNSYSADYQTFLRQKYGAFYSFEQLSQLQINFFEFKLPIHDLEAFRKLSQNQGYLIDLDAIDRQLFHKKLQAQNSKDQLMLSLFFLEKVITICKRKQKVPHIRQIKAVVRHKQKQQSPTQLIQIIWANNYLKQDELKQTKRTLGFSILSKRYNEMQIRNFIQKLSFKKLIFGQIQHMRTTQSLADEQLKKIEKWAIQNQRYLDQGYYYDGYVLRNSDGFSVQRHPNLQKAVHGWLAQENARVAKFNGQLRNKWNQYVANYKQQ